MGPLLLAPAAVAGCPDLEALLARGLAVVERREVVNPYAGRRREAPTLQGQGERCRCLRWPHGPAPCVPAHGPGGGPCS